MNIYILQFLVGSILLYYGAEFLIIGSKSIAEKFKLPLIIVGITLVAFGTSLPELIVCIIAIMRDDPGIVVGNVIGSNITNIGLVLGITAMLTPIFFSFKKIKFDLYFLTIISLLPMFFIYLGDLVFWQGLLFILLLGGYCWELIKKDNIIYDDVDILSEFGFSTILLKIILGIVGLGLGAHFFVIGAKGIAIALGVSSLVIGMSIIALGTSLPELAASITAAKHNQIDFVIGNIIGSNIINIVAVLGVTMIISPISIEFVDMMIQGLFMILLTIGLLMLLKFKGGITKLSACILIFIYLLFIYFNFYPVWELSYD